MDKKPPTISELNSLGILSGTLSEVHVKNLQVFPFIYFNGISEAKLDYDVVQSKDNNSYVHYDLTLNQTNDHLDKRFAGLEAALRALFWKEIQLKLTINGEEYKNE